MDQPIHDADDGIFDRTMYDYDSRNTIWVIVYIRVAQSSEYSDSRFHNGILIGSCRHSKLVIPTTFTIKLKVANDAAMQMFST
jgi:hypothetical protein